jgi:hypothetical protein
MDVIFQEVVELVRERADGAIDCFCHAVAECKREEGLVAGWEGNVLQLAEIVCDLYRKRAVSQRYSILKDCVVETDILASACLATNSKEPAERGRHYMFSRVTKQAISMLYSTRPDPSSPYLHDSHCPVQTGHRHRLSIAVHSPATGDITLPRGRDLR